MAVTGSAVNGFQVRVVDRCLIKAADCSIEPYILPLSNLDHTDFTNPAIIFYAYRKPSSGDFASVVSTFKTSLPKLLNHFFHLAGRMCWNSTTKRQDVVCNNAGAEFLEAIADIRLADVDFHDVRKSIDAITIPHDPRLVLSAQIIGFACGSFTFVCSSNHLFHDAYGFNLFTSFWAEIARTKKISRPLPNHDISFLQPRSPPTYGPYFEKHFATPSAVNMLDIAKPSDFFPKRLYKVDGKELERLRSLASEGGVHRVTSLEAFSAYVWKVLASVVDGTDTSCQMGWAVDGRSRMGPEKAEAMSKFAGNVQCIATGVAKVAELKNGSLSDVASKVTKAIHEVTSNEDHILDLVDWIEIHKGRNTITVLKLMLELGVDGPGILVSSCHHLPHEEVDFGFGKPIMATFYMPGVEARLALGIMTISPSLVDVGSWIVYMNARPDLLGALESRPGSIFQPLTAALLGLERYGHMPPLVSRI